MRIYEKNLTDALSSDDPTEQIRAVQFACRHRRDDLLGPLIALLPSAEAGYFVEECLPQFGEKVGPPLKALLGDPNTSALARRRAAGVLAALGDREAVPVLLDAIEDPNVNQAYLRRLHDLAPDALASRLVLILDRQRAEIMTTRDEHRASYYASLLRTLGKLGTRQQEQVMLSVFQQNSQDWRIRKAADKALATG